jgi:hypothetical protein
VRESNLIVTLQGKVSAASEQKGLTDADDERLWELSDLGISAHDIGRELERTATAVYDREPFA